LIRREKHARDFVNAGTKAEDAEIQWSNERVRRFKKSALRVNCAKTCKKFHKHSCISNSLIVIRSGKVLLYHRSSSRQK